MTTYIFWFLAAIITGLLILVIPYFSHFLEHIKYNKIDNSNITINMTNTNKKETSTSVLFIGGALSKLFHKHLGLCILLLCTLLNSCKSVENKQLGKINKSSFVVKSVKKQKNGVYVIYAHRNDSIFKIVSYYDGMKNNKGKRLVKGTCFNVSLQSEFAEYEKRNNIFSPCNEFMEFRGVAIGKEPEHGIDDVWFCKELNGPFLDINEKGTNVK